MAFYFIFSNGGFDKGGFNFDAKIRRQSIDAEDLFYAHIGGMDTCAKTLLIVEKLKKYSFLIRKTLSKKIIMKFLPKIIFAKDDSFDYAEKIENLIKQTNK